MFHMWRANQGQCTEILILDEKQKKWNILKNLFAIQWSWGFIYSC